MEARRSSVELLVLGPVEARRDGAPVPLGGSRQRTLLALLLLESGRPISPDWLVDQLWSGEPSAGAESTIRSYVSRLRTALGESVPITGTSAGYAIDTSGATVDARRFEAAIREGDQALGGRNTRRARGQLDAALALWRGRPFGELAADGALRAEADRLEQLHLRATELRIDADLALGFGAELVDELETLVAAHPYREAFWRQLMLALYRAERQADALAAYHRARKALAADLGIEPGEELRALEAAILRQDVEPAAPPEERHNLPAPMTSFIGREEAIARITGHVRAARLTSLTGVGGVGKTRLAIEVARSLVADFADGTYFVDLAPLSDPGLVATSVAGVLEVREQAGASAIDRLASHLRAREMLLVLDNCEHVRDAAAELATHLLATCPSLRVLATSREVLGVPGEVDVAVQPLALPDPSDGVSTARESEAVRLLIARAREARPDLADDDATVEAAARICADLDGLPLGIELAAARARVLSMREIEANLHDRFRFLVSWRRLTTQRHRTLREAMDWSYDLLDRNEQRLLAELSVFAGGFTLDAVGGVCTGPATERPLELVERLVEASLVVVDTSVQPTRYRLLETVRQYGADRLEAAGATEELRERHARYFAGWAEARWIPERLAGQPSGEWFAAMVAERSNLQAALAWSRDHGDSDLRLRLVEAHWYYWWVRGELTEGRAWLEAALAAADTAESELRALVLHGAAGLAWAHGDFDAAESMAGEARSIFAKLDNPVLEAATANTLGVIALYRGDYSAAETLLRDGLRLRQADPNPGSRALLSAIIHVNLGEVALGRGDRDGAAVELVEARELYASQQAEDGVALAEMNLGGLAVEAGRIDEARPLLANGLRSAWRIGFRQHLAEALEQVSALANRIGTPEAAAALLGGAGRIREEIGSPAVGWNARLIEHELATIRAALGEEAAMAAREEGRSLSVAALVERALGMLERAD